MPASMRHGPTLLVTLHLASLLACGAGERPSVSGEPAVTPSCVVAPGWRWAVLAVLPGARVLEYEELPLLSDSPAIVTWWSDHKTPPGYEDAGPWLRDPIWLAWRTDLGTPGEDADIADPWTYLATIGGEDGPGRLAVRPEVARRLGLSHLPFPDSGAPPSLASPASALDLILRRIQVDDAAEALAGGKCEAAWFDGPARARWQLIGGRWLDRVRLQEMSGGARELRLAVPVGDATALASARMLQAAQPLLESLGYEPVK